MRQLKKMHPKTCPNCKEKIENINKIIKNFYLICPNCNKIAFPNKNIIKLKVKETILKT